MAADFEKKINKRLLDFVIWWSYLGDQGERIIFLVKKFLLDVYRHLQEQEERFKKWYRE